MVLEKTLESPLDGKEIQPVHPKEDQSWVFIGRTDAKAETLILWLPDAKSWLIGKDPDAVRDWGQDEKGQDEMVGWHHELNGHGFGWTLEVGDGEGGLVFCGSWGHKESDTTERLNWTELILSVPYNNSVWCIVPSTASLNPHFYEQKLLRCHRSSLMWQMAEQKFKIKRSLRKWQTTLKRRKKGLHRWPITQITELPHGPRATPQTATIDGKIW